MASRWDSLLDTKPIPLMEHLLNEVAKLVSQDLVQWPLPVREWDERSSQGFAHLLEAPRPALAVWDQSFQLARWELERAFDAFDDYMRNRRWEAHGLSAADKPYLLFMSRWLVEQLLALGEATEGRVNRHLMLSALERIQRDTQRKLRAKLTEAQAW